MNRITAVFQSESVTIERFDHPRHYVQCDHDLEATRDVAVTFVERGRFSIHEGKEFWHFQHRDVLVSVPGKFRHYRHFEECPDDVCLSISFAPDVVEDGLGRAPSPQTDPRIAACLATDFARFLIGVALSSSDPLAIEEKAFHCILALSVDSWDRPRDNTANLAHAQQIRRAIEKMTANPAEACSLSSLARETGMSAFHFARIFSALVGLPPHQYLLQLRIRRAAAMLREGASVMQAAVGSGFENVAHFSRTFQRRMGMSPSRYPSGR